MKKSFLLALVVAATAFISACSPSESGKSSKSVSPTVASEQAIKAGSKGFTVGSMTAAKTVYVFFDPQCPHCAALWDASKSLHSQAKFVWIPVGFMSKASTAQGAVLLAAANPSAAMDEHEKLLSARQGGIAAMDAQDSLKAQVGQNTKLLESFGVKSIPWSFTANPAGGAPLILSGGAPATAYARALGLSAPPSASLSAEATPAGAPKLPSAP